MKKIFFGKYAEFLVGCALGASLFFVMYGPAVLDPANIDWCVIENSDTGQHFIGGWAFLRDDWRCPPGLFYGLSGTCPASIFVIDGIPLAALFVKLLRGARPEPFQYLGAWGLVCFALQGGMAALLMHRIVRRRTWVRVAGVFFLLLSVPFLTRYPLHTGLSSHFLILWALYLALGKWRTKTAAAWTILVSLALAIHPYLAAMCLALYLGSSVQALIGRRGKRRVSPLRIGASWLATLVCGAATLWLMGVFDIGIKSGSGVFGQSQINLNGLVNPISPDVSALVLPMPCQLEAENIYLGAGLFLLFVSALPALCRTLRDTELWKRRGVTAAVLIAMALFSINCRLYLGKELLVSIVLPPEVRNLCGVFRGAGRFVWPAWYMLVALTVGLAAKKRGIFLRTALFAAAISLQLYDLGNGLVAHTWAKNVARQEKRYVSPYETAVPHIGGARRLCFTVSDADFCDTGYFALKHGLAADDYYFARDIRRSPDPSGMRKLLDDGKADGDCVYLLLPEERELVEKRFPELKSRILATPGRSVLAPNAIGVTPSDGGCR